MSAAAPLMLPVILIPVGVDDDALDACLAALDAGTPTGARVWLADDAQAGPRGIAIIERWLKRTALQADYTRRPRAIGEAAHLDEMLKACGDADALVLASDAVPLPGWAAQLSACAARDPAIATATPWCNAGETAAWPRVGEVVALDEDPRRLALAATRLAPHHPELPSAVNHAVFLRGRARLKAGGLDASSYASWYAALIDLSLRMAGLGWRNALCETAFVLREREGQPLGDDVETLSVRWPAWHARLAQFLMEDPLHGLRDALRRALAGIPPEQAQQDLFADIVQTAVSSDTVSSDAVSNSMVSKGTASAGMTPNDATTIEDRSEGEGAAG